jgi:hypothetical protein
MNIKIYDENLKYRSMSQSNTVVKFSWYIWVTQWWIVIDKVLLNIYLNSKFKYLTIRNNSSPSLVLNLLYLPEKNQKNKNYFPLMPHLRSDKQIHVTHEGLFLCIPLKFLSIRMLVLFWIKLFILFSGIISKKLKKKVLLVICKLNNFSQ